MCNLALVVLPRQCELCFLLEGHAFLLDSPSLTPSNPNGSLGALTTWSLGFKVLTS